jgi:hypothetical protein
VWRGSKGAEASVGPAGKKIKPKPAIPRPVPFPPLPPPQPCRPVVAGESKGCLVVAQLLWGLCSWCSGPQQVSQVILKRASRRVSE